MFQFYIKVILSYLKLSYLKPMYSWTTFYSPHCCCIFHQFMDQASTSNMDDEYSTTGQGRAGLALQGNVVQGRTGQGLQVQGRTYSKISQKRLAVSYIKISCPCSRSKCLPTVSWHRRMTRNLQKIWQAVWKV